MANRKRMLSLQFKAATRKETTHDKDATLSSGIARSKSIYSEYSSRMREKWKLLMVSTTQIKTNGV